MLYDRRDFGLLRLTGACQWLPLKALRELSALDRLRREAEVLSSQGSITFSRNGDYLMLSPKGYQLMAELGQVCRQPTKRPYTNSPALRRRLEVGTLLLTFLGAGIRPALGSVDQLSRQPVFLPAFELRNGEGNLINAASCAAFGHWDDTAYMAFFLNEQNPGFFMNNELSHLRNLSSVFSDRLDTPQALLLAGESYRSVYELLTKKDASARHGKHGFTDYSEAWPRLELPACLISCDDIGTMQLSIMRQPDYRARIARAAFGSEWAEKDDQLPEADGHVHGNPLVIAVDMDLKRIERVCDGASRQGRREIMVAALKEQMSGLLLDVLPQGAPVRPLRINEKVLSAAFGGEYVPKDPWPDEPLVMKGGLVHV